MQIVSKTCWYKNWKKMVAVLSKFTVLCLSFYFEVVFLELILFHNRFVHYYTRIFLILLPHPVVSCHIQDIPFGEGSDSSAGDTESLF